VDRSERDREQIVGEFRRELEASPEVVLAFLHGSFSTGGTFRDIDVAVWLAPDRRSRDERFRYALDLSVHLHVQLRCQVDVRVLNDAPLGFRYHALQGRPLVTRDDEFLDELRARTWDDYVDFQPFARQSSVTTSATWNDTRRAWAGT
jgi:predicted nucleotidyltransferase